MLTGPRPQRVFDFSLNVFSKMKFKSCSDIHACFFSVFHQVEEKQKTANSRDVLLCLVKLLLQVAG